MLGFGDVFGEAGFDEFADEGGGEWFFGMEADGAVFSVVGTEVFLRRCYRAARN